MAASRIFSVLLAAAMAGGVYFWVASGPDAADASAQKPADPGADAAAAAAAEPPVQRVRVLAAASTAQPLAESITLRGVTEASKKVEIRAQTEGLVVSTPLPRGAEVSAGDGLCEIEPGDRPARLAEAEAKRAQAEADLAASQSLERKGFAAAKTLAADRAALEAAKADVMLIELDIARTRIAAPFDGRLETDAAETGELLRGGDLCATVIALDPIRLVGFAPERAIAGLALGREASARLVTGQEITAEVSFISRAADPETRTFRVEATAANSDEAISDGMTVEIAIPMAAAEAHLLPHSALTLDDAGRLGVRTVQRLDGASNGVAGFIPVEILRDGPDGVWLSGLPAEVDVILVGQEFVRAGAAITAEYADLSRLLAPADAAAAAAR